MAASRRTANASKLPAWCLQKVSLSFSTEFKDDSEEWPQGEYKGRFYKSEAADGTWQAHGYYYNDRLGLRNYMFYWDDSVSYRQEVIETGEVLRAGCLAPDSVMPLLSAVKDAIELADPVAGDELVGVDVSATCEGGQTYVLRYDGDDFIMCDVMSSGGGISAFFGETFETVITEFKTGDDATVVLTEAPVDKDGNVLECPKLVSSHASTQDGESSRSLRSLPQRPSDEPAWWQQAVAARGRQLAGSKTCVFMHGAGYDSDQSTSTTSFTSYWGNAHTSALAGSHCSSVKFIRRDTVNRAWDDLALQQHFCDVAAGGHNNNGIGDTWVFSHDFGSLVVAGAIDSGLCHFQSSSKWHQISSPWAGTFTQSVLSWGCQNFPNGDTAWEDLNNQLKFCTGSGTSRSVSAAWASMLPTYTGPRQSFSAITSSLLHNNVDGGMCGHDAWGISSNSCLNDIQSTLLNYFEDNDGITKTATCKTGAPSNNQYWVRCRCLRLVASLPPLTRVCGIRRVVHTRATSTMPTSTSSIRRAATETERLARTRSRAASSGTRVKRLSSKVPACCV